MIRDVAVRVQEPEDFLADTIFPSHIVVPRCQGEFKEISMYSDRGRVPSMIISNIADGRIVTVQLKIALYSVQPNESFH